MPRVTHRKPDLNLTGSSGISGAYRVAKFAKYPPEHGWQPAELWGVPHVVDYRDPWSGAFYLPKRIKPLQRLERASERRMLERASAAVITPGVRRSCQPSRPRSS